MLEIVGVFPDVDAVNGGAAGHDGRVLVGEGFDEKFSVFATTEPGPAASEDAHRAFGHFLLPLFITAKGFVDLLGQFVLGFLSWIGEGFPEDGVVRVTPGIVTDGGADLGRHRFQVAEKFLEGFFLEVWVRGDGFVEIVDVGGVMFVVMQGHRLGIDIRFERIGCIGKRGQGERPSFALFWQALLGCGGFCRSERERQETGSERGTEKEFEKRSSR